MTASLVLALLLTAAAGESGPDPFVGDARLSDIRFLDAQRGWAVGDRGAIWHTNDGGRRWQLQNSGVACTLAAVCFRNEKLGWAAGGFAQPYTHTGSGVLLTTRDSGQTWTRAPKLMLPALRRIGFFDDQHGWAIGCPSAMYPSGVFVSGDAGRSWRPLPGGDAAGWLAGDFLDPQTGVLAGRNGALAVVRHGQIESIRTESLDLRSLAQFRLADSRHGWLAGDGGLLLLTADRGAAWQPPATPLPPAARHFDFAAMAVRGPQCWLAGAPGTRVFHTPDAGRTWSAFATGSPVPLRAIAFADDLHGGAVGDLGTILTTGDGGRTWQRQRAGGTRAALLGIFGEPDDVPLELFARFCGNEGYLGAVEVFGRRDIEVRPRDDVPLPDRLHEAVVRVGGCGANVAWQFPLRQAGLRLDQRQIVAAWDRVNQGRAIEELQARAVRQIRTWRPDVIVTNSAGRQDDDPLNSLLNQVVVQAIRLAADASGFPDQLTEAGLEPWQVKRVYAALPAGSRGSIDLITAQLAPRLGRSLAEAAAEPRGLLQDRPRLAPSTLTFQDSPLPLGEGPGVRAAGGDFFGGIVLPPGGDARREASRNPPEGLDVLHRIAQKRRHVQAILDQSQRAVGSPEQLLAQTNELTRDLDDSSAAEILYQLADRYYRTGCWPLAAETFQRLAERFPEHPLAPLAMRWLVQYHAGEEAAWRTDRDKSQHEKRYQQALTLGKDIERTRPDWFAEPAFRFPLAAACRNLGQPRQAERFYMLQSRGAERDAWWACAQAELRLADPKGRPAKAMLSCVRAEQKPRLDGKLDDPVWQLAKPAHLQSGQHDDGDWPAVAMLAYDAEFLYFAAHCRQTGSLLKKGTGSEPTIENRAKNDGSEVPVPLFQRAARASGPAAPAAAGSRPRDADLTAHDRIDLLIDLDRDFATYYQMTIDHRGWTSESCWGDKTWDPTWFVAAAQGDRTWTVEAAIPLEQLTGRLPKPGDVWAIGIQRVAPGAGFQSWTTPAAVVVQPEGFGYMVFE